MSSVVPCHAMMQSYFFNMLLVPSKDSLLVLISSLVALVTPNMQVGYPSVPYCLL